MSLQLQSLLATTLIIVFYEDKCSEKYRLEFILESFSDNYNNCFRFKVINKR